MYDADVVTTRLRGPMLLVQRRAANCQSWPPGGGEERCKHCGADGAGWLLLLRLLLLLGCCWAAAGCSAGCLVLVPGFWFLVAGLLLGSAGFRGQGKGQGKGGNRPIYALNRITD